MMEKKKQMNPRIRFKGFGDDWEQRKLKQIVTLLKDGTHASHAEGAAAFLLSAKNIYSGRVHYDNSDRMISFSDYEDIYKGYTLNEGDLLLTCVGSLGRTAIFHKSNVLIAFQRSVAIIRGDSEISNEFLKYELQTDDLQQQINSKATLSAQSGIYLDDIGNLEILFPSLNMQSRLVDTLRNIDSLIAANEKKVRQLKLQKKLLLQRLFSVEWRFKDFKDPWEQRKLGDIVKITMGQSPLSKNYTSNPSDHILVQGNADISSGIVKPRVWTTQVTKTGDKGDVLLSVRAPVGEVAKTQFNIVLGRGMAAIKGNEYIFQMLKYLKEIDFWSTKSTGSTFDSINSKDIKNAEIVIPVNLNEVGMLGTLLYQCDSLIAANEEKVEQLKQVKKFLMQNLFV